MFNLSTADLNRGLHFLRMWNPGYLFRLCCSPALLFVSIKGKAIQLNTEEIPCQVKIRNEAIPFKGTPSSLILMSVVYNYWN